MFDLQNKNAPHLRALDDLKTPSRRPWLWIFLVALALAGLFLGGRTLSRRRGMSAPVVDDDAVVAADDPASRTAPPVSRRRQAPVHPPEEAVARLTEAGDMVSRDQWNEARELLLELLPEAHDEAFRSRVESKLGRVNIELVMTPRMMPEKTEYLVRAGDSLGRIASRFGTTLELLKKSNRIANPNLIKAGDRIRTLDQPEFAIVVNKQDNTLLLKLNGKFFKRYSVGTGEYGRTPEGSFVVVNRLKEPPWWPAGGVELPFGHPDNILGTRWLGIEATGDTPRVRGYGIHGTWDDSTIGTQSSAGCVRMRNSEVEELFALVQTGVPVTIR